MNLKGMVRFYQEYSGDPAKVPQLESPDLKQTSAWQRPVAKLPASTSEIGAHPAAQTDTPLPSPVAVADPANLLKFAWPFWRGFGIL